MTTSSSVSNAAGISLIILFLFGTGLTVPCNFLPPWIINFDIPFNNKYKTAKYNWLGKKYKFNLSIKNPELEVQDFLIHKD